MLRTALDHICCSIRSRYADHGNVMNVFQVLYPSTFVTVKEHGVSVESVLPVAELCGVNASEVARELEGNNNKNITRQCASQSLNGGFLVNQSQ